jgi:phage protein D
MAALASVYIPDFDVMLNGTPIPAEMRASVSSVRFEESLQAASRVEIQLANLGLRFLNHPLVDLNVQLQLSLGYQPNGLEDVFTGDISGVEPSFPSSGIPTISISALDFGHRMTEGTKNRGFPYYLPDSVVAAIVAAENQLLMMPDPGALAVTGAVAVLGYFNKKPTRWQHRQSDNDFLRKIAAEYGFDLWVDGRVLNMRLPLPGLPVPDVELGWGESLIDFTPKLTSIGEVVGVRAKVWIQALKTELAVSLSWDGERVTVRVAPALSLKQDIPVKGGSQVEQAVLDLPDIPFDHPIEAIKRALGELRKRINNRLTAKGSIVGDPRVRAGSLLSISNVGKFSGANFRVTSATHTLDGSGYRTTFDVRQELI